MPSHDGQPNAIFRPWAAPQIRPYFFIIMTSPMTNFSGCRLPSIFILAAICMALSRAIALSYDLEAQPCMLCDSPIDKGQQHQDSRVYLSAGADCCASRYRFHPHCFLGRVMGASEFVYACCGRHVDRASLDGIRGLLVAEVISDIGSGNNAVEYFEARAAVLEKFDGKTLRYYLTNYPKYSAVSLHNILLVLSMICGKFPTLSGAALAAQEAMASQEHAEIYRGIMEESRGGRFCPAISKWATMPLAFLDTLNFHRALAICSVLITGNRAVCSEELAADDISCVKGIVRGCIAKLQLGGVLVLATEAAAAGSAALAELLCKLAHLYRYSDQINSNHMKICHFLRQYLKCCQNPMRILFLLHDLNMLDASSRSELRLDVRNILRQNYRHGGAEAEHPFDGIIKCQTELRSTTRGAEDMQLFQTRLEEASYHDRADRDTTFHYIVQLYGLMLSNRFHKDMIGCLVLAMARAKNPYAHPTFLALYSLLPSSELREVRDCDQIYTLLIKENYESSLFIISTVVNRGYFHTDQLVRICEVLLGTPLRSIVSTMALDFFSSRELAIQNQNQDSVAILHRILTDLGAVEEINFISKRLHGKDVRFTSASSKKPVHPGKPSKSTTRGG